MVWAVLRVPTAETIPWGWDKGRYLSSGKQPQSLAVSQCHLKEDPMYVRLYMTFFSHISISRQNCPLPIYVLLCQTISLFNNKDSDPSSEL